MMMSDLASSSLFGVILVADSLFELMRETRARVSNGLLPTA